MRYSVTINGTTQNFGGTDAFRNSMRTDIGASTSADGKSKNHVIWRDLSDGSVITETFVGQRTSGSKA